MTLFHVWLKHTQTIHKDLTFITLQFQHKEDESSLKGAWSGSRDPV